MEGGVAGGGEECDMEWDRDDDAPNGYLDI
jgi:hypothetical protein